MSNRRQLLVAAVMGIAVSAQPGRFLTRVLSQATPTVDKVVAA